MVCEAISVENIEVIKDKLAEWNERGCTANEDSEIIETDKKNKSSLDGGGTTVGTINKDSGSGGCFISNLY